jgi:hypothetical protein
MSSQRRTTLLFLLVAALLTGCVDVEQEIKPTATSPLIESDAPLRTSAPSEEKIHPSLTPPAGLSTPISTPLSTVLPLPLVPSPGEKGEVPQELIDAIKADLASRLGINPEDIEVVSAEAVLWNDGSLGCPEKGYSYLQVITPGYRVILKASGKEYDYRTNEVGFIKLCLSGG